MLLGPAGNSSAIPLRDGGIGEQRDHHEHIGHDELEEHHPAITPPRPSESARRRACR
jgi:hypothetical protein